VRELHAEHQLYSNVIDKRNADKTIEEPVRGLALRIAHARLWKDQEKKEAGR